MTTLKVHIVGRCYLLSLSPSLRSCLRLGEKKKKRVASASPILPQEIYVCVHRAKSLLEPDTYLLLSKRSGGGEKQKTNNCVTCLDFFVNIFWCFWDKVKASHCTVQVVDLSLLFWWFDSNHECDDLLSGRSGSGGGTSIRRRNNLGMRIGYA